MLNKTIVLESINDLPEKFSLEELVDKLILIQKIELGLEQSENGLITSDEELDKKFQKWLS